MNTSAAPSFLRCPSCGKHVDHPQSVLIQEISGAAPVTCVNCGAQLHVWPMVKEAVRENFMGTAVYGLVGANSTHFDIRLNPGERLTIDYLDHGIPRRAKVLYINYTPNMAGAGPGVLFPLEMHANSARTRTEDADSVTVYPVPIVPGADPQPTTVAVWVLWIDSHQARTPWHFLLEACEAYVASDYSSMVVPANVALESSLAQVFASYCARVNVDFKERVSYAVQMDVLLPMMADALNFPRMSEEISGELRRLRALRNQSAHSGELKNPLAKLDAADLLAGALLGFRYLTALTAVC